MTEEVGQPRIVVRFKAPDSATVQVDIHPDVSIGQLALAAAELTELAREARAGERMRQANEHLATIAMARQLQTGRRT